MFTKLLVANRGEVALRVIRACREMGIATVAVYSEADRDSLHTRMADQSVCIGPAASARSYLNMPNIISAAITTGAEAVHPGYGFLAENAAFARAVVDSGLTFVGPSADSIDRMGDKAVARRTMMEAGVPCVPGSEGVVETTAQALVFAEAVGFPVLIKASAGGGGKGLELGRGATAGHDLLGLLLALQVCLHCSFVKLLRFPFHDAQGSGGAGFETGTQAVTESVRNQAGLAVDDCQ